MCHFSWRPLANAKDVGKMRSSARDKQSCVHKCNSVRVFMRWDVHTPLGPSLQAEGPHYLTLHGTGAVDTSLAVLPTRNRICQIYAHSHPTLRRQAQLADGTIRCQAGWRTEADTTNARWRHSSGQHFCAITVHLGGLVTVQNCAQR